MGRMGQGIHAGLVQCREGGTLVYRIGGTQVTFLGLKFGYAYFLG